MTWRFIHIPKCGGMSFRKAFEDYPRQVIPTHDPAYLLPAGPTVAVIRHPLDRLVSIYAHANGSMTGFRDWVDSGRWREWPWIEVAKTSGRHKLAISLPQTEWLRSDTWLIRFERYDSDLATWAAGAGFPPVDLQHRNISRGRQGARWDDHLREDQAQMMWEYYAADFARRRAITLEGNPTSRIESEA